MGPGVGTGVGIALGAREGEIRGILVGDGVALNVGDEVGVVGRADGGNVNKGCSRIRRLGEGMVEGDGVGYMALQ